MSPYGLLSRTYIEELICLEQFCGQTRAYRVEGKIAVLVYNQHAPLVAAVHVQPGNGHTGTEYAPSFVCGVLDIILGLG